MDCYFLFVSGIEFKSGFMAIKTYIKFSKEIHVPQDDRDFGRLAPGED
jgi:hypothetical protein